MDVLEGLRKAVEKKKQSREEQEAVILAGSEKLAAIFAPVRRDLELLEPDVLVKQWPSGIVKSVELVIDKKWAHAYTGGLDRAWYVCVWVDTLPLRDKLMKVSWLDFHPKNQPHIFVGAHSQPLKDCFANRLMDSISNKPVAFACGENAEVALKKFVELLALCGVEPAKK